MRVKSKRAPGISHLLLHTPKCHVNTLAKRQQVKTFCVKEHHLDSKDSPYATVVQISFNKFHSACTPADSEFPHDSESFAAIFKDERNKYGAW